ncbi:MAG: NEW3 domain-containing protein [Candidatus Aenigmatarchaeota archaeon]
MEKRLFYAILLALPLLFIAIYGFLSLTGFFVGFGQPAEEFEWWNISWHYRVRLEINTSSYERKDWPIEYRINFTDLLPYGNFDENSTRVIEYSPEGQLLGEIPSQFEKDDDFNPSNNAVGVLAFLLNGSNPPNTKRVFFVYYDTLENGAKEKIEYPSGISYSWDGEELNVNASGFSYWIDTLRGEGTSGLYRVRGIASQNDIWSVPGETERTIEYLQYSNGTYNFSFDLKYNMSLKFSGPVRLVFEQKGYETVWNSSEKTEGFIVKRYYFYDFSQEHEKWIKVETIFKNLGDSEIERNSTFAGAFGLDAARAFGSNWQSAFGNTSYPGWWYASDFWSSFHTGIIHVNRSTENFFIQNSSSKNRIGIELSLTSIPPQASISTEAILHFNDTSGDYTQVRELRNKIENPEIITQFLPEVWYVAISPKTNSSIFNRNESVLITANISEGDPYNLTKYMNATLDMGTSSESDDQTVILYDDGTHGDETANDKIFTNSFDLPNDAIVGIWTINFTAYSQDLKFLNSTTLSFNVTDVLNVSVTVLNKKPMVGSLVTANIYVKNYRQDSWIAGAEINCSYDSSEVLNKTDYNNGTYSVNFTAPPEEGTYTLLCNATKNGNIGNNSDSFTTEPGKTYLTISAQPSNPIIYNITLKNSKSFEISSNATNYGNGTAYSTNISLELLNGWQANKTLEECGEVEKHTFCIKSFNITVPNATPPGNYYINVSVAWKNPDGSTSLNKTEVNVTVASNPLVNVSEEKVSGNVPDATEQTIGNFTVVSVGNDDLRNVSFYCYSGTVCSDFTVEFIPANISSLSPGLNYSVAVNVSVPLGYATGNYSGSVNVSAENDDYKTLSIEVSVPINRTWSIFPEYCQRSETPDYGIVCEVNVSNLGNTYINFTVYPEEGNYTKVNETNFTTNRQSWHIFSITYNITGIPMGIYNSTFTVDAIEEANPDNKTLVVTLLPYVEPIINISIIPNATGQFSPIEIFANITDRSNTGIAWAKLNITLPNGSVDSFDMERIYESGNLSTWYLRYEEGNTSSKGRYNVTVYAKDNVGNVGERNSSFIIFAKLTVSVSTLSDKYYQGDTGSIYYSVKDANNQGLANVNVTFKIEDSNKNISFKSTFISNEEGMIYPMPSFSLPSDSPLGTYTLISESEYTDEESKTTSRVQKNSSFQVLSRTVTVTGLFADLETAVVWYPENIMKFGILVYNGEGRPVDPTSMNLTVYDPAGNLYFTASLSQMSKQATGLYLYSYAMPANTPSGMFLAVVNATQNEFQTMKLKAFRVARGGPYDLWLELFEHEVRQGDYLDFAVTIENKGEVSQDVFLEWWVSSENKTYYSSSGWVYTPANSNQTVTQQAYIFTTQPLGTYELNVKMTYDNVQAPLTAKETFIVISKEILPPNITYPNITYPVYVPSYPVVTPTAPVPIPTPSAVLPASISIISYNSNISLVRGTKKTESVIVKNTGLGDLTNISVFLFGIPTTWFTVTPETFGILPPENSTVFLINFDVPKNAIPGEYKVTLSAFSGVVSDQKYVTITVYESLEELLKSEIEKLKNDVKILEREIGIAEKEGKNVTGVLSYLEEINKQINQAEENLANNKTEDAIINVATAKTLVEKARDLLLKLTPPIVERVFIIPYWLTWLIPIIIACVIIALILIRKKGVPSIRIKPALPSIPIKKVEEVERKEELVIEKEKLLRMLEVLEKERKEGIISATAYAEMKKSVEEKLEKIEKKLK